MIMQHEKYFDVLKESLLSFFKQNSEVKVFLFGSSIRQDRFGDIDVGIKGRVKDSEVRKLREFFEESNFPFKVDLVNFNKVDEPFEKNVLEDKVLWIKR